MRFAVIQHIKLCLDYAAVLLALMPDTLLAAPLECKLFSSFVANKLSLNLSTKDVNSDAVAPDTENDAPIKLVAVEEAWLAVLINQQPSGTVLVVRNKEGCLLVKGDDLQRWRLHLPKIAPIPHQGISYYPLAALPGLSYRVDEVRQELIVEVPLNLFYETQMKGATAYFNIPTNTSLGAFLNYDIFVNHVQNQTRTSGLLELGGFSSWGVGLNNFLVRDTTVDTKRLVRLDTNWTRDQPDHLTSLRLGDGISRASSWGRSVRFGGLQVGSNFATQPGLITFPLPESSGEAVLPSTVDLFINNALRMRSTVPAGPFSIHDLPVVSGQGGSASCS